MMAHNKFLSSEQNRNGAEGTGSIGKQLDNFFAIMVKLWGEEAKSHRIPVQQILECVTGRNIFQRSKFLLKWPESHSKI